MLIRLLLLIALGFAGLTFWRSMQGNPLLRLPGEWKDEGAKTPVVASALKLRQSMARILVKGRAAHAGALLDDVDGVLARLVEMSALGRTLREESEAIGGDALSRVKPSLDKLEADAQSALGWLGEAHGVLLETAASEVDGAVERLRGSMRVHAEELRMEVEAKRELNAAMQQKV